MLRIKDLSKTYTSAKGNTVFALKNISIDFDKTGLVFILGKSGSGKSTLLNIIGGIDTPTSGEILINGRSNTTFSEADLDSYRNTHVGFIFQEYNLLDNYTVGANVALSLELQGKVAERKVVEEVLRSVDLVSETGETLYDRKINELSGGQKQRVSIARALIKNPEIILADEPTGALDSETGEQLYELLKELSKEKLIIVVSHDKESAELYADRIINVKDGEIIKDTKPVVHSSESEEQKEFIKGKLPIKKQIMMGVKGLLVKKGRFILSTVSLVIALSIFGFSYLLSSIDLIAPQVRSMYENGYKMFTVAVSSKSDYDLFKEYNNGKELNLIKKISQPIPLNIGEEESNIKNAYYLDMLYLYDFVEIDSQTGIEDVNIKPDTRFIDKTKCNLPKTKNEIAINDIVASAYIEFGYKTETGEVIDINTPDDLIGRKIGDLRICGVYENELSEYAKKKNLPNNGFYENGREIYNEMEYTILNSIPNSTITRLNYVSKDFFDDTTYDNYYLIKLSGNINKDLDVINAYMIDEQLNHITFGNIFSSTVNKATLLKSYFSIPGAVMTIVLSILAILLILNYLLVNIDMRKREFGVLRSLGATKNNIVGIVLVESVILSCIAFILSCFAVSIVCYILDSVLFFGITKYFVFLFPHALLMFLLSFVTTTIATIIPVRRLVKKKPIEIINDK